MPSTPLGPERRPGVWLFTCQEIPCGGLCRTLAYELVFPLLAAAVDDALDLDPDTLGDVELTDALDEIRRAAARLVAAPRLGSSPRPTPAAPLPRPAI
jgi:hypothetical protein